MTKRIEIEYELKAEEDDDIQEYKRPWVGLTMEDVKVIEENAPTKQMAIFMAEATLKDKNT